MRGSRGFFITFEGIEGSGKSTQLVGLGSLLREKGLAVRLTREPGGTAIGEAVRRILLRPEHSDMTDLTELFLYGASRSQHVHQVLKPALNRGEILLCDRFSDATLAYQGFGRGLDRGLVEKVNEWAADGLAPDLTVLLDCPVELGLRRSWERMGREGKGEEESRFEAEHTSFHQLVRAGYLEIARGDPQRVIVVDGSATPEAVQGEIRRRVLPRLPITQGA